MVVGFIKIPGAHDVVLYTFCILIMKYPCLRYEPKAESKASGAILLGNYQSDRSIPLGKYLESSLKPTVRRSNLAANHVHSHMFQNNTVKYSVARRQLNRVTS